MEIIKLSHPKIKELKLRAAPVTYSSMVVDESGNLVADNKITADEATGLIKGYLCVWGQRDTYGTKFVKGCFAKSLNERGVGSNAKYKITFLWMHDQRDPIGQFTVLREDDYGLYFEAQADIEITEVPNARRAVQQITKGTLNQFSIGFDYVWDKIEYDETDDSIVILECELFEGSVVTRGSVPGTYAFRSVEEQSAEKERLDDDTESFVKSLPRSKQLEIRSLITRHISLAQYKPDKQQERTPLVFQFEPNEEENRSNINFQFS